MRIILVTGKGGVGKTTTAAATALRLADRGVKTLLISTDAAHSLGDALDRPLTGEPTEVADALHAVQVQTQSRLELAWRDVQGYLITLFDRGGADPITAEELTVLPGVDEVLALLAIAEYARCGHWDALVVDCAPTAETLRLLALPEALSWYIAKIFPAQRRLARGMRPLAGLLGRGDALPPDGVFAALLTLHEQLGELRQILTTAGTTSVRLVLTPESVVIAEARRTLTALALYGYRVDEVVVNRVIPPGTDPWRAQWAAAQATALGEVRASFAGIPLSVVPYAASEPVGEQQLRGIADALFGALPGRDPAAAQVAEPLLAVHPDGADFRLEVSLPLAQAGAVEAVRAGDDLVLTVGGNRRVVALPSVLRRCEVVSGRFADGRLIVRFRRDPALWPQPAGEDDEPGNVRRQEEEPR